MTFERCLYMSEKYTNLFYQITQHNQIVKSWKKYQNATILHSMSYLISQFILNFVKFRDKRNKNKSTIKLNQINKMKWICYFLLILF